MILDVAMIALVAALLILVAVQVAALRVAYDTNRLAGQAVQALDDLVRILGRPAPAFAESPVQQAAADVRAEWRGERTSTGAPLTVCTVCAHPIVLHPGQTGWTHRYSGPTENPHKAVPPPGMGESEVPFEAYYPTTAQALPEILHTRFPDNEAAREAYGAAVRTLLLAARGGPIPSTTLAEVAGRHNVDPETLRTVALDAWAARR